MNLFLTFFIAIWLYGFSVMIVFQWKINTAKDKQNTYFHKAIESKTTVAKARYEALAAEQMEIWDKALKDWGNWFPPLKLLK